MKLKISFAIMITLVLLTALIILKRGVDKETGLSLRDEGEHEATSGAMEALNFFTASRAYPNTVIPEEGYYRAYLSSQASLKKMSTPESQVAAWQLLGPKNIGGRTKAIAINPINPTTIYVGAASGGLWRSYTGGVGKHAWEYIDTGYPVLGVSAIAIDPSDTSVIYIGTGEVYGYQNSLGGVTIRTTRGSYGIGILKTTDAGTTWSKSLDWTYNQRRGVQAISIDPVNPKIVFAATTEGTYKSIDAGASWTKVHPVIMAMDVDINPTNPNIIFVSCGDLGSPGAAVYRSKDGGAAWEKLTRGLPTDFTGKTIIDIHHANPDIIYAHVANHGIGIRGTIGIFRSTNGGDSWEMMSSVDIAQYQGWYSHFVAVHPTNPQIVIAGGIDLWKSTNAGRTFTRKSNWAAWYFGVVPIGGPEGSANYSHADHHAVAFHPTNPDMIYFTTDGGLFRTTDGAETFAGLNGGYATTQFYNGFSCSATDSLLAMGGLQDNATVIYEGTPAWRRVIGGDGFWTAIDPRRDNIMYGEVYYLNLVKSVDGGQTWFDATAGIDHANAGFSAPFMVSTFDSNVLYGGTDRVYKSTNAAAFWIATNNNQPLDGNPVLSLAMAATSTDTVFAATAPIYSRPHVFRTLNGGATWQDVTGILPDRYPMDIAVDPTNSRNVYVVFSGFGASHLFKSHDAGLTWIDIGAGLPDAPSSAVTVDPQFPQHIYFGNDLGVYVSLDGGQTWQEWSKGLPTVLVADLTVSPSNRVIRVATHGNGVWQRPLIGQITSVQQPGAPVVSYRLHQNYPNPVFLSSREPTGAATTIHYELSEAGEISLKVYNALGQEVATLAEGVQSPGRHEIHFDGAGLPAGVYFYTLRAGNFIQTRKMLLLLR